MADAASEGASTQLPAEIEQTVQAVGRMREAHEARATPLHRLVDRMTAIVARPSFIAVIAVVVAGWIGANILLRRFAGWSLDGPGYHRLEAVGELTALYITVLVLMSQRRKDELSELREQLTLEMAILTEQKVAKLIELSEEARRDNPLLANRVDDQAAAMASAADPEAVLEAFRETQPSGGETPQGV